LALLFHDTCRPRSVRIGASSFASFLSGLCNTVKSIEAAPRTGKPGLQHVAADLSRATCRACLRGATLAVSQLIIRYRSRCVRWCRHDAHACIHR
jgi:hypothetical protein